ncbi:hypothetical protein [Bradyrhizobium sp.]|uniref:hypothetical protein n=1 Tax=Bradyrhizobium sp. TaxID=376 RepID=UPI001DD004A5|nr:hypothetical protein [Bradyrhizobium sp.]MBV8701621.1 hypothetical protein [Bradyrhizobium sp.]MBV8916790.1 hypothetical protein [Bradyrhizobium sp.]
MPQAASNRVIVPRDVPHEPGDCLITELQSLSERVHAVTRAIDTAIALERTASSAEAAADVVVLDDVMPRYLRAISALQACSVHLDDAVQFLRKC